MATSQPVTGPQEAITRIHAMAYGGAITTVLILAAGAILLALGVITTDNHLFYSGLVGLQIGATSAAITASMYGHRTSLGQMKRLGRNLTRCDKRIADLHNTERRILAAAAGDDELRERRSRHN